MNFCEKAKAIGDKKLFELPFLIRLMILIVLWPILWVVFLVPSIAIGAYNWTVEVVVTGYKLLKGCE